jgi:hypothetical protein
MGELVQAHAKDPKDEYDDKADHNGR